MEDIQNLRFSLGRDPDKNTAHRGITSLAFTLLMVQEENRMWDDQAFMDGASNVTPQMLRTAQQRCPARPTSLNPYNEVIKRYVKVGRHFFMN